MGVTRSTPADRRQPPAGQPAGRTRWPPPAGAPGPHGRPAARAARGKETVLLIAGLAVALLGLVLAYRAVSHPFGDVEAKLQSGEVLNLNQVGQSEKLLEFMPPMSGSAERAFAARQVWQRVSPAQKRLPNVGELGRLRVTATDVEDDSRLEELRARLEAAQAPGREGESPSVRLFTTAELREMKPRLVVRSPGEFRTSLVLWAAVLFAGFFAVHAVWRLRGFAGDRMLLPALLILTSLGFLVMMSVRDPLRDMLLFRTFAEGVLIGCGLLLAASLIDWERSPVRRMSFLPLLAAFGLSALLILFGSGPGGSDAKVNLFGFQPVEVIKILVVLFLAGYFLDRWEFLRELPEKRAGLGGLPRWLRIPKLEYVLPPVLAMGLVLFFFFLQKDLGPALVLAFLFLLLYSVARGRPAMLAVGAVVVVAAFLIGYKLGYPRTVSGRIAMWLSPWDNGFRGGEHLAQALWAVAGGSLSGMGLGLGDPANVPEIHTDMVLAAIGEELGFVGLLAVFSLYAFLIYRGLRTALRASGVYGFFLALGLTLLLALPVLLIAGGVLGLVPLSGVVSPFLSFGRSAMLANFFIVGMLLAISARHRGEGDGAAARRFQGAVRWVGLGLGAALLVIVGRAAWVQLVQEDDVLTRGALTLQADGWRRFQYNPRLAAIAETIPRGTIFDRNGIPLASSDIQQLGKHGADYAALGLQLTPAEIARGGRVYPFGGRTFHLLGDARDKVNWAASNSSYVERDSRIRLQGYDDYAAVVEVVQPDGTKADLVKLDYRELIPLLRNRYRPERKVVQDILNRPRDVRLSIDARLQVAVEDILARTAQEVGRNAGAAAVVMDAQTGDLLASASYPWPHELPIELPLKRPAEHGNEMIDRARYGIYPPGSTFKLVTAMAALRKDPGLAARTFECKALSGGRVGNSVRGWGRPIRDDLTDHVPHGTVDMEEGIRVSCNAYFAQLATYAVGAQQLHETADLMGIKVAKPNTPAQLKDALPQAGYGQGQVVATPFQMARVAATVANNGAMPEGRWVTDASNPRTGKPVQVVTGMPEGFLARSMREVVTSGTASQLAGVVPAIAGKTGTAEVKGKPSHSWFIGYTPYGAPSSGAGGHRIAFAVIIENGGYGGRVAAKAAGEIVQKTAALGLVR